MIGVRIFVSLTAGRTDAGLAATFGAVHRYPCCRDRQLRRGIGRHSVCAVKHGLTGNIPSGLIARFHMKKKITIAVQVPRWNLNLNKS